MYYTGFADEASDSLDLQIKATKELGWKYIETRKLFDANLATIDDETFEKVCDKLSESGVEFNCYGSGIGNWATRITKSPESSYDEMRKAIPRMQRLGIKLIRIMNFPLEEDDYARSWDFEDEAIKRMKTIVEMVEDTEIICVHENCSGWASLSYEHTLRMLEKVNSPHLKLVYDTGNPVAHVDVRGELPYKNQNSWEFYQNVKEHIEYVHIKDAVIDENGKPVFTFPGEGDGYVREIVTDLLKNGYDGGFSMEPHMQVIAHDQSVKSEETLRYENYIEYGKRFMKLVDEAKQSLN